MKTIFDQELDRISLCIMQNFYQYDSSYFSKMLIGRVKKLIENRDDVQLCFMIKEALEKGEPCSVIRIGDGEANIITYGTYPETPEYNLFAVKRIVAMQKDNFVVNRFWALTLKEYLMSAIAQADIIGVTGLDRRGALTSIQRANGAAQRINKDPRGIVGHWRAVDVVLRLAEQGMFFNKTLAPAHLYFSIIENIKILMDAAQEIFIINNRVSVFNKLSSIFNKKFTFIEVGKSVDSVRIYPKFIQEVYDALPDNMSGCLCLIGAGPWAEIYCSFVKQKGGVAVDVGSGLDLLDGERTRPIHNQYQIENLLVHHRSV